MSVGGDFAAVTVRWIGAGGATATEPRPMRGSSYFALLNVENREDAELASAYPLLAGRVRASLIVTEHVDA